MTQVYIRQHFKREFWTGKNWTRAFELAKAYTPKEAAIVLKKRWSKGTREYYSQGGFRLMRYIDPPYTQTKAELGKWEKI